MRVLFLSPFVWGSSYQGRYHHFFLHLRATGARVAVLEPRLSGEPPHCSEPGLRFLAHPRRADEWAAAAWAVELVGPDVVLAASPPESPVGLWSRLPFASPACGGGPRPLLVFDYSDSLYFSRLGRRLGPAGLMAAPLGRAAVASLARRADLVTAASERLRRELPPGSVLVPDPPGPAWGRLPTTRPTPARAASGRRLSVAVLGSPGAAESVAAPALGATTTEAVLALGAGRFDLSYAVPRARPAGPGPAASEDLLTERLAQADVAVLLGPAAVPPAPGAGPQAAPTVPSAAELLLAALTAGCPVLAAAHLKPSLEACARTADLAPSELSYFSSLADLEERLLRFSLTADPGRRRRLQVKAERLRWAPVVREFARLLAGALSATRQSAGD